MIFMNKLYQTRTWPSAAFPALIILHGLHFGVKAKRWSTKAGYSVELASMWMNVSSSVPSARALKFNFSHPAFSPFPLPLISFHIFPSLFYPHQRESPEMGDNPSSEQRVFHVLGRHASESAASFLSSLQIPASASQPCRLPPCSLSYLVFSHLFMFSFIMEPTALPRT